MDCWFIVEPTGELTAWKTAWIGHLLEPGAQSLAIAYRRAGRRDDAERIAALVPRAASKARIFAALGDKDRTFAALDQMVPMGPTRIGWDVLISPDFAFLSGDPRLKALRKKVGLPEQTIGLWRGVRTASEGWLWLGLKK